MAFEEHPTPAQQRPNRAHQGGLQFALYVADGINEAWARIVRMQSDPDFFGRALLDRTAGGTEPEFIERADGPVIPGGGRDFYLARLRSWPLSERSSLRYARGEVVDIGCGAGRVPLHLPERGFDVVGIDVSRRAVRAARLRGVKEAWLMSAQELSREIAAFDTIILFGNNFGIFGSPERVRKGSHKVVEADSPRDTDLGGERKSILRRRSSQPWPKSTPGTWWPAISRRTPMTPHQCHRRLAVQARDDRR